MEMTRTIRRLAQVALQYTGAASHQQQAARISHLGAAATQASSHLQQSLTSAWASPTSPAASSSTAPLASPLALHQRFISSSACVAHGGGDKSSSTERYAPARLWPSASSSERAHKDTSSPSQFPGLCCALMTHPCLRLCPLQHLCDVRGERWLREDSTRPHRGQPPTRSARERD